MALLCGRYEGIDERVRDHLATDAVSIGPYVLSGGELAAMVVADAMIRKLPGALGHADSAVEESFSEALGGAPEYPHYTRPASYRGWDVPEVLLSGDHARVREWRLEQSRSAARPRRTARAASLISPGSDRAPSKIRRRAARGPRLRLRPASGGFSRRRPTRGHEHDHREHRAAPAEARAPLRRRATGCASTSRWSRAPGGAPRSSRAS